MAVAADGFDWDAGNRTKCQKHGVTIDEIEALLLGDTEVAPDVKHSAHEEPVHRHRPHARGMVCPFCGFHGAASRRNRRLIRPISARYMHSKESGNYEEKIKPKFRISKPTRKPRRFSSRIVLSSIIFSWQFTPMHFEIRPKEKSVNLRMSEALYDAVRETAKDEGVPYQRYIRHVLERAVSEHNRTKAKAS